MINLLDILFPKKCLYCGKEGKYICQECFSKINHQYFFQKINHDYFDYLVCSSLYQGITRTQIHNFKFHEQAYLYEYFIEVSLMKNKIYHFLKKFDFITFVPMNDEKQFRRGYNQSELLAECLGKQLGIKVVKLLKKPVELQVQSTLSKKDRINNVKHAFQFVDNINIQNKNIILVDDILTTGATARASSKLMKENGSNKICVFTIAKA